MNHIPEEQLKLMCILAHPDDESLGTGGILARYAAEGVATYLVTATRGEHGWSGAPHDNPGPAALGRMREAELRLAARALGLQEVSFLDYIDGELDQAAPDEAIGALVAQLRRVRPHVVVTFDPSGFYGHPDHIAISQYTTAAIVAAADTRYADRSGRRPHRVSKLYYLAPGAGQIDLYQAAFGELAMTIDGVARRATAWPDWAITTRVDASAYWRQVWQAIACHQSQLPSYQTLLHMPDGDHRSLWGTQTFYRVFSLVNGGREVEEDLFVGLR
jgi:LmbE family N-acetylglucosaminyl deacetylase